jgi:hypothetical protein
MLGTFRGAPRESTPEVSVPTSSIPFQEQPPERSTRMTTVENITASVAEATDDARDWGIVRHDAVDQQFSADIKEIREAELAAERNASTLRIF